MGSPGLPCCHDWIEVQVAIYFGIDNRVRTDTGACRFYSLSAYALIPVFGALGMREEYRISCFLHRRIGRNKIVNFCSTLFARSLNPAGSAPATRDGNAVQLCPTRGI